jgi:hypothetical protein
MQIRGSICLVWYLLCHYSVEYAELNMIKISELIKALFLGRLYKRVDELFDSIHSSLPFLKCHQMRVLDHFETTRHLS